MGSVTFAEPPALPEKLLAKNRIVYQVGRSVPPRFASIDAGTVFDASVLSDADVRAMLRQGMVEPALEEAGAPAALAPASVAPAAPPNALQARLEAAKSAIEQAETEAAENEGG